MLSHEEAGLLVFILFVHPFSGPTLFTGHFCGHVDALLYPGQSSSKH